MENFFYTYNRGWDRSVEAGASFVHQGVCACGEGTGSFNPALLLSQDLKRTFVFLSRHREKRFRALVFSLKEQCWLYVVSRECS